VRVFQLDICDTSQEGVTVFSLDSPDNPQANLQVFSLDSTDAACEVNVFSLEDPDCCNDADIEIYIPGPPGPQGPVGPQGPSGASGLVSVISASSSIPIDQYFTIVNASAPTTQTLPLISSVLIDNITSSFTVVNLTSHNVAIIASGSDEILVGSPVNEPYPNTSFSFVATPLGWVII